jgi:AcrR family transcriptional regulator
MAKPKKKPEKPRYHHGNLREALLAAALDAVREHGVSALSLREVARRAGVSHAAPAHHFGDKAGLLTAIAVEGFERFGQAQREGAARGGDDPSKSFAWLGWAYVMFAAQNREYFEVMFRPDLLRVDDDAFLSASHSTYELLDSGVRSMLGDKASEDEIMRFSTTAWAHVHGLAKLWLDGNLKHFAGIDDLDGLVRKLFELPAKD